jgi:hypothetical protein
MLAIKNNVYVQIDQSSKAKRRKFVDDGPGSIFNLPSCGDTMSQSSFLPGDPPSRIPLGSPAATRKDSTALISREKDLLQKEKEFKRRSDKLDERILKVAQMEEEKSLLISQLEGRAYEAILAQLESFFTCSLCYEIMACPYSLNPGHCGHTYCGLCILKWFFSRLHGPCGGWHASVDCPICRSLLTVTPERIPRSAITFPFSPNRIADSVVQDLVGKLATPSKVSLTGGAGVRKSRSKKKIEVPMDGVAAWREGGCLRAEWLKRDREGRTEMNTLTTHWSILRPADFLLIKDRLGV